MKKISDYVKRYPFDASMWGLIGLGLLFAAYLTYTVFLVDDMGVKYGNRLEGIENVTVSKSAIENKITANEQVTNANVSIKGRIVNVEIYTKTKPAAILIDELGSLTLTSINGDIKGYYDIQIFIAEKAYVKNKTTAILGYLKSGNDTISWTFNKGAYNE